MSSQPGTPLPTSAAPSIPDFELLRPIGRGSYGDVWLARSVTGIFRAIKIVWRDRFADAEPFERELRGLKEFAAISLGESTHMALLHVGRNEASGFFYYVMELADDAERGRAIDPVNYVALTLAELRRMRGRLPAEECVRFGVELARSLAGLHRRGLVHRDIKPSNVILVNGVPKLADIGLVAPATSAQTFVGTEGYVPSEGPGSPGADVYALGKVLYELVTGLDRQTFPKLPPDLGALPDCRALLALNEVILRACEPRADKRYRDAAALLTDLQNLHEGRPVRRFARWQTVATAAVFTVGAIGVAKWWKPPAVPLPSAARESAPSEISSLSIAVLPFTNMSDDPSNAYFADGVHEDVLTNLVHLRALKVISRNSMLHYRDAKKTTSQIARELGVTYVLEGSVRRDGNNVRVTGQLIKAATDEHVWAKNYDRELRDIFAVQADLAREITRALQVVLSPAEDRRLDTVPTSNSAAYDLLKQAKAIEARGRNVRDQGELVLPLLKRAVALDPNYAEAWAMLASLHGSFYAFGERKDAGLLDSARMALARADLLAPEAYYTLVAGANLGAITGDRDVVNARRRRIIELFPGRAEEHLAFAATASYERRWPDALASYRAAARLEPRNSAMLYGYVDLLRKLRRYEEAESIGRLLLEIEPDNLLTRMDLAELPFLRLGSVESLERLLEELSAGKADDTNANIVRARSALMMGRSRELIELSHALGDRFQWNPSRGGQGDLFMVAVSMAALGDELPARRPLLEKLRDSTLQQLQADPQNLGQLNRLGMVQAMLGERADGAATLARARELVRQNPQARNAALAHWENAAYRIWVGESQEALAEFARLLRDPVNAPPWGNVHRMRRLCLFQSLQGDPRFEALLNDPKNNAPLF